MQGFIFGQIIDHGLSAINFVYHCTLLSCFLVRVQDFLCEKLKHLDVSVLSDLRKIIVGSANILVIIFKARLFSLLSFLHQMNSYCWCFSIFLKIGITFPS